MADEGGVDMLVNLLQNEGGDSEAVQRQASKALANLGVNPVNKEKIYHAGGIAPLIKLSRSNNDNVCVEAIAALANLAVNDNNEVEIANQGGLEPILKAANSRNVDLQSQSARALRNLSVNDDNKKRIISLDGVRTLRSLVSNSANDRVRMQAMRALGNLGEDPGGGGHK